MQRLLVPVLLSLLAGCVVQQAPHPPVMACPTLPTSRPSPHPDPLPPISATPMTLQPGHWDWADHSYFWTPPYWVPRTGNHPVWQDGYWTPNGGVCVWNPGHFLS